MRDAESVAKDQKVVETHEQHDATDAFERKKEGGRGSPMRKPTNQASCV